MDGIHGRMRSRFVSGAIANSFPSEAVATLVAEVSANACPVFDTSDHVTWANVAGSHLIDSLGHDAFGGVADRRGAIATGAPRPPTTRHRALLRDVACRIRVGVADRVFLSSGIPLFGTESGAFLGYRAGPLAFAPSVGAISR